MTKVLAATRGIDRRIPADSKAEKKKTSSKVSIREGNRDVSVQITLDGGKPGSGLYDLRGRQVIKKYGIETLCERATRNEHTAHTSHSTRLRVGKETLCRVHNPTALLVKSGSSVETRES